MLHPTHRSPDGANGILRAVRSLIRTDIVNESLCGALQSAAAFVSTDHLPGEVIQSFIVIDPQRHIPMIPILVPVELCHDTFPSVAVKKIRVLLRGEAITNSCKSAWQCRRSSVAHTFRDLDSSWKG